MKSEQQPIDANSSDANFWKDEDGQWHIEPIAKLPYSPNAKLLGRLDADGNYHEFETPIPADKPSKEGHRSAIHPLGECFVFKVGYEVIQDPAIGWRVDFVDVLGNEEYHVAIFIGPYAEQRARAYADWQNYQLLQRLGPH